jgi:F-type H+-transporting ATPase subunit gamma
MGAELRVFRRRIRSVQSTKKITRAMELIAASRIAKATQRVEAAKPYAREITRVISALASQSNIDHALINEAEQPTRAAVLLVTSDRGLAGGYNSNAIRAANELAARLEGEGKDVERYVIGRKGAAYFNFRNIKLAGVWTGFSEQPNFIDARGATEAVVAALSATSEGTVKGSGGGEDDDEAPNEQPGIDELWVVYTRFVNSVSQTPMTVRVSPVKGLSDDDDDATDTDEPSDADEKDEARGAASGLYEFEPSAAGLIAALLPRYISSRIFSALLESAASESAARRRAMKSASDNATELIKTFTRLANQARQAEITQEISEIVGGADALAASGEEI